MNEMIGKQFGDYKIVEKIGDGGMGTVYKARQISLDRDVAVKFLASDLTDNKEFVSRFEIEARSVAQLGHPNIIQVYGRGITDDGHHYLAMEYVDGEDLSDKLERGKTFSEKAAIDIIIQACRGLESAGKKSIIHRDIKPGNIIITKDGEVKITDFGLAKCLDSSIELTKPGAYMGTVHYSSPEQGLGKPLDHRTDIYSLGIVLFQLLTNELPFNAESASAVIYQQIYEQPPLPKKINPKISSRLEAVVLKSMAKKREARYQNMRGFRRALEAVKQKLSEKEEQETVPIVVLKDNKNPIICWNFNKTLGYFSPMKYSFSGKKAPPGTPGPILKPGIKGLLTSLNDFTHVVTTGASEVYAKYVLKSYGLLECFENILGRESGIPTENGHDYRLVGDRFGIQPADLHKRIIIVGSDEESNRGPECRQIVMICDAGMANRPSMPLELVIRGLAGEGEGGPKQGFDKYMEMSRIKGLDNRVVILEREGVKFWIDYYGNFVSNTIFPVISDPEEC